MNAEEVLQCLDFLWFGHNIFKSSPCNSVMNSSTTIPKNSNEEEPMTLHTQTDPLSSPIDHIKPSGLAEPETKPKPEPEQKPETRCMAITSNGLKQRKIRRKGIIEERGRAAKLEFQELKGLTELGLLNFGVAVEDERLVSIVPGLQRGRRAEGNGGVYRPYLSDAWLCRIPFGSEGFHRDGLKSWAHAVACSVK